MGILEDLFCKKYTDVATYIVLPVRLALSLFRCEITERVVTVGTDSQ